MACKGESPKLRATRGFRAEGVGVGFGVPGYRMEAGNLAHPRDPRHSTCHGF